MPDTLNQAIAAVPDSLKNAPLTITDTAKYSHNKLSSFVLPAALVGYGALSFAVHPLRHFDFYVRTEAHMSSPNFHTSAESYFLFAPIVMVYGLNALGDDGKNRFGDRTALLGLSTAFVTIATFPLKHAAHRLRPDGSDYLSFPSGHTSVAFTFAEFLNQEYGDKSPIYSIIGYSFATATGVVRIYNRAHWFSDVVAGAGFGILSTKAAYLVYPYIKSVFNHNDKDGKSTFVMPTYQNGMAGLSFSKSF